jgi:hypothetical protein
MENVQTKMSTLDNSIGNRERVICARELSSFTIVICIDK